MMNKNNSLKRIARLIPPIRRLHDSALDANIKLDKYAQENEKLRSFMEQEAEKIRVFNIQHSELNKKVANIDLIKDELKFEKEKCIDLVRQRGELELKLTREQDLGRLNRSINKGYTNLISKHSILRTDVLEKQNLVEKKMIEIEVLSKELDVAKATNFEQESHSVNLDKILKERLDEIDTLTKELQNLSLERQNQSNHHLFLESLLQKNSINIEQLSSNLEKSESDNLEQIRRSLELEGIIIEKNSEIAKLGQNLLDSKIPYQEQIRRSLELENIVTEKNSEIAKFDQSLQDIEQHYEKQIEELKHSLLDAKVPYEEQIKRSLELEGIVTEKNLTIEKLGMSLQNVELKYKEQVKRSLVLENDLQIQFDKNRTISTKLLETQNFEEQVKDLLQDVEKLNAKIASDKLKLQDVQERLGDSQHFATIRSEEALARILGKISSIDFKGSQTPMITDNGPLSNYSAQEQVVGKYFDLLINCLTGTLYEDKPISPWSEGRYDEEVRNLGRDWPATAPSMIGSVRMKSLQQLVCDIIENNIEGDAIETGVWRGGACILIKSIFDTYGCHDRKVWVADSFQGLPKPDADNYSFDANDDHHSYGALSVSQEEVEENFRKFGVLDNNIKFLKGWFKDTLHKAPIKTLAILRLDGDMEESTVQSLDALYHKVSKGGYVIIDDYGLGPCRDAINIFRQEKGIKSPLVEVDGACVYWQVQ